MKKKFCEFETIFEGENIIKNTALAGFSLYKKTLLKESRLMIVDREVELINTFSFSILNLADYPSLKTLEGVENQQHLYESFTVRLICNSLLNLIMERKVVLAIVEDSYEFLNGITEDLNNKFVLSLGEEMEDDPDWIESGIINSILKASKTKEQIPINKFKKELINQFLKEGRSYDYPFLEIALSYLRKIRNNFEWIEIKRIKESKWLKFTDIVHIELESEQSKLINDQYVKLEKRIIDASSNEPLLKKFVEELFESIQREIDFRTESN